MTLLPISKIQKVSESEVNVNQVNFKTNSVSGDVIDGGTITNFTSTGIKDQSDATQIIVQNDHVEIASDLHIKGTVKVENLEYVSAQVPKLNVREAVMVNQHEVLWKDSLGKSVTKSYLQEVGILKNLQVRNNFYVADGRVGVNIVSYTHLRAHETDS